VSDHRVTIEFDVSEFRGRFSVDASDFDGMTPEQIEREIAEKVTEFAKANVSFFAKNVAAKVKEIQAALAEEAKKTQAELIEQFEAGDFGDVEFTELALMAGMSVEAINRELEKQRVEAADV
jgi:hypothetical protein